MSTCGAPVYPAQHERSALRTTDPESRIICPIMYDELVLATGATGDIPKSLTSVLDAERVRPFEIAKTMLSQAPEAKCV